MPSKSITELIPKVTSGSETAAKQLVDIVGQRVNTRAQRSLEWGTLSVDAEDIAQFVYLRMFEKLKKSQIVDSASLWKFLELCCFNTCSTLVRHDRASHRIPKHRIVGIDKCDDSVTSGITMSELVDDVEAALGPECRAIIEFCQKGLTPKEIHLLTGLTNRTIERRNAAITQYIRGYVDGD